MQNKVYKVLIADDDPMVAMINEQYVQKYGTAHSWQTAQFEIVKIAKNGKDALDFLANHDVDLVILDVYMPYLNGVETLKSIRDANYQLDVIMVTAANDSTTVAKTMHLGVVDYLIKPFAMERFHSALDKFVLYKETLNATNPLEQTSLDAMLANASQIALAQNTGLQTDTPSFGTTQNDSQQQNASLPKGIQTQTLSLISTYLQNSQTWLRADTVASETGVSIVTARHYISYLVAKRLVQESINYETGGRPSLLYKWCAKG